MSHSRHIVRRRGIRPGLGIALSAIGLTIGLAVGCTQVAEPTPIVTQAGSETSELTGQLGRIHLRLQPRADKIEPEARLQVEARFVEYHGVDEDFVRERAYMPRPAIETVASGECVRSEELASSIDNTEAVPDDERELSFVDMGALEISLAGRRSEVPMALVPDLLPYVYGVEYLGHEESLPDLGPFSLGEHLSIELGDTLLYTADLPAHLEVSDLRVEEDMFRLSWESSQPDASDIIVEFEAFDGTEPQGSAVTCRLADTGKAQLPTTQLGRLGLAVEGANDRAWRVTASRFHQVRLDTELFTNIEVVAELRDQLVVER